VTLLILGGTADGRRLAETLHKHSIPIIYSVAGLVRVPDVNCPIVSGGFSQLGGLSHYIKQQQVTAILDATHPYAATMSNKAITAAMKTDIPYWRFNRPQWVQGDKENWQVFNSRSEMFDALTEKKSVFITAGQLDQNEIDLLAGNQGQKQLLRTAVAPKCLLPSSMLWVKAIGPFSYDDELALMKKYAVDALVSKNSGGSSTVQKLNVARDLAIDVYMLTRPMPPAAEIFFTNHEECIKFVLSTFN
jgi:precorrin-6A/cobalt-precorrin-6A reductase